MENRVYIKEGDNERNGLTSDISQYIGTDTTIICTIGEYNTFRVNETIRLTDVRIIENGEKYTTFRCWHPGSSKNEESTVEMKTDEIKSIRCAGHYHSSIYKTDMSQF